MIPTTDTDLILLKAKISAPAMKEHLIPRDRLLASITAGLKRRLTLLCAPAGFGKTTLLTQWVHAQAQACAWVTLDDLDNDNIRFWRYMIHALASAAPSQADRILPLANILPSASISTFLDALINELCSLTEPLPLILDNYHRIEDQRIHDNLSYFIDYLPSSVHILISTRTELPFSTVKWMLQEERTEISAHQLEFTKDETIQFFNEVSGIELHQRHIQQLMLQTEGWVTGLQLVSISFRSETNYDRFIGEFHGNHRSVSDYLFHEVVSKLPDDVYRFLLATSVLDRMDSQICTSICPETDSLQMLESVKNLNLFLVPLDDRDQWYRYYHLFAQYLQKLLQKNDPVQWLQSNLVASKCFAERGWMDEAIDHAIAAKDFALVELYLEQHLPIVLERGEISTLLRWFESFPKSYGLSLEMSLMYTFTLMLTGQFDRSEAELELVDQACQSLDDKMRQKQLQSGILFVKSNLLFAAGKFTKWLSSSHDMLNEMLPENPTYYNFNYNMTEPQVRRTALGLKGLLSSETEAVGKLFMEKLESHGWQHSLIHLYVKQSLAEGYYEWNQLDSSRSAALFIEAAAISKKTPGLLIPLRMTQSLLYIAQGLTHVALSTIEELIEIARRDFGDHWVNTLRAFKARIHLKDGHIAEAKKELAPLQVSAKDRPTFNREYHYVTLVRLLAKQHKEKEALRLLELLKPQCEREQLLSSIVEISMLQALLEYQRGQRNAALSYLHEALLIGERNGYVRSFLDEGMPMAELLSIYLGQSKSGGITDRNSVSESYVNQLLTLFPNEKLPSALHPPSAAASLSRNEINLIRLIRNGATNKQIAAELYLSEGTVKVYLSRLYEKLGVSSRTQALMAVQDLRLSDHES
ncbi:LuxR C-terminal-related transcriptional regulator [Paenibacillus sp. UNC451MF]|uniref:LuxR C-terminal-related transcriptional regulator n=1 Tax=Paenibacillus sp. UNC451MF TaxID=1449063 RepID=UPI00048DEEE6|nr:LuxR C-terminal-related transcriptional regulator [Paenibacillus sp. UNC451MF]